VAAVVLVGAVVLAPATPAQTATCNGRTVTIMGTDGPDHIVGSGRADVILAGRERRGHAGRGL
jgi:hypothetical protein